MAEDRARHDKRRNGTLLHLDELNHKRFGVDILVGDGRGPGWFFSPRGECERKENVLRPDHDAK